MKITEIADGLLHDVHNIQDRFEAITYAQQKLKAFNNLIALIKTLKPCLPCLIMDYGFEKIG
ncbi:MAG: hypothetical protein QMD01_05825 [Thermodesulfovibrionales bacterium]|nr:hypothetical protein [Thermodesulfovibrionales bacterium]